MRLPEAELDELAYIIDDGTMESNQRSFLSHLQVIQDWVDWARDTKEHLPYESEVPEFCDDVEDTLDPSWLPSEERPVYPDQVREKVEALLEAIY